MLACIGGVKQLDNIDRRHWGLQVVPEEVYRHERTLEELCLDFNAIQELPPVSWRVKSPGKGDGHLIFCLFVLELAIKTINKVILLSDRMIALKSGLPGLLLHTCIKQSVTRLTLNMLF